LSGKPCSHDEQEDRRDSQMKSADHTGIVASRRLSGKYAFGAARATLHSLDQSYDAEYRSAKCFSTLSRIKPPAADHGVFSRVRPHFSVRADRRHRSGGLSLRQR